MTASRLVVLNGSPNPDGNSMRLASLFVRLAGGGAETVHLYAGGPAPCCACLQCVSGKPCPLEDGMEAIVRAIEEADCLVLASPLHFSSLTAPMIAFISRLQPWWHGERALSPARGRVGVLLVNGGSEYEGMFRPARSVAAAAFKALGIRFAGMAGRPGTDAAPVGVDDAIAYDEIKQLAESVQKGQGACSNGS